MMDDEQVLALEEAQRLANEGWYEQCVEARAPPERHLLQGRMLVPVIEYMASNDCDVYVQPNLESAVVGTLAKGETYILGLRHTLNQDI